MEKKKIKFPIIVEGKYDKNTLLQIFDATVITTDGFGIFNSKEKQSLIRRLAASGGIILLTDSDGGGVQIRSFLSGILPRERIFHLYVPQIKGKERRKSAPSRAGLLGVEGMRREVLLSVLAPFITTGEGVGACRKNEENKRLVTRLDFYEDGLSGTEGSAERRKRLAKALDLPTTLGAKALIEAINLLFDYGQYKTALAQLDSEAEDK